MQKTTISAQDLTNLLVAKKGEGIKVQVNDLPELEFQSWQVITKIDTEKKTAILIETDEYNRRGKAGNSKEIDLNLLLQNLVEAPAELLQEAA